MALRLSTSVLMYVLPIQKDVELHTFGVCVWEGIKLNNVMRVKHIL